MPNERIPNSKEVPDGEVVLPRVVDLHDPNPHGLPVWTITSLLLAKEDALGIDGSAGAWWFECETKEGALIIVGETWGGDGARRAQVHVDGKGQYPTRYYSGEEAADRVVWFRKLWEALCADAGKNPDEEHWFVLTEPELPPT